LQLRAQGGWPLRSTAAYGRRSVFSSKRASSLVTRSSFRLSSSSASREQADRFVLVEYQTGPPRPAGRRRLASSHGDAGTMRHATVRRNIALDEQTCSAFARKPRGSRQKTRTSCCTWPERQGLSARTNLMSSYLEDPVHRDLNLPELRRLQLSSACTHRLETQYCRP
jgi:hypothetical protein